ncbi:MAG: DoxX family membrane protein [Candidatus Nanopelagicales bacterium]
MTWTQRLLQQRLSGGAAWIPTVVRLAAGVVLVAVSLSKFTRHADLVAAFERYGIPLPELSVYLAGTVELVGGLLLVLGLLTRPAALVVAAQMVVAVGTGGRIDRDFFHLWLGLILLAAALFLAWSGSGRLGVDERLARDTTTPRSPVRRAPASAGG